MAWRKHIALMNSLAANRNNSVKSYIKCKRAVSFDSYDMAERPTLYPSKASHSVVLIKLK